jgi:hypothetical protein
MAAVTMVSPPPALVYDDRPVPITERTPAIIIVISEPGNPGRRIAVTGNPTPTVIGVPMPTAIMMGKKAPTVKRVPDITVIRVPYPAPVIIRPPIRPDIVRYPDIGAIGVVVTPTAMTG